MKLALLTLMLGLFPGAPPSAQFGKGVPMPEVTWDVELGRQVPLTSTFTDHTGRKVRLSDIVSGEQPVVLALVYHECPMLCNLVMGGLLRALKALPLEVGTDFQLISISIDPAESAELAASKRDGYVQRYDRAAADGTVGDGWHFLVGDETNVRAVSDAVGFGYTFVPATGEFAHAAGITILTPKAEVAQVLFGTEFSPRDLRLSLVEASEGRLGTNVDKILLRCFQYDPSKGKYGVAIMTVIRTGGVLTVLVLGGFVVRSLLRDRLRPSPAVR